VRARFRSPRPATRIASKTKPVNLLPAAVSLDESHVVTYPTATNRTQPEGAEVVLAFKAAARATN